MSKDRYKEAGVALERAERIVSRHAPHINATMRPGFQIELGGFGACIDLSKLGEVALKDLVLVSTTDGVGTKVELAHQEGWHEGIGEDCVAMCTNDIWAMGAEPLWFMNYIGMNRLDESHIEQVMTGMSRACQRERCMLVGGETAEMPGTYVREEGYELVGFCVGGMSREESWESVGVRRGDWVVCAASSGMHSNGFSLVRCGVELGEVKLDARMSDGSTLRRTLLTPTRQYGELIRGWRASRDAPRIKRAAHVTGGGLERGLERLCGEHRVLEGWSWSEEPEWASHVRGAMGLTWRQGAEVWNMGVGFLVLCEGAINKADLQTWCQTLSEEVGFKVWIAGRL